MNSKDYRIGLLKSFDYLSGYVEQADFNIYNKALGTHNFGNGLKENTTIQVDAIIKLINQKNQLLVVLNGLTKAINRLDSINKKLLWYRYVKKKEVSQVIKKFDLTKGIYYSKIQKALAQFEGYLKEEGIDKEWFFENYTTKPWFRRLINFASDGGCF